jgi:glycosyltransferase involved in cell wall biosynthesis
MKRMTRVIDRAKLHSAVATPLDRLAETPDGILNSDVPSGMPAEVAESLSEHTVVSHSLHKPKICLVGPMIGRNPGYVTTTAETLTDLFISAGYPVISVSTSTNRYVRLLDIITTLIRRYREIDIQCLQVYGGLSFFVEDIASWLGRLSKRQRMVMVLHGGLIPEFLRRHPNWYRRVLSRADSIVAPSPFLAREVTRHGFKVQVIPNVVDLPLYPYRHRRHLRPRLLWMRTFHPAYNPEMAIRVLARVQKVVPETTLVIAGQDKGTQDAVQRLARSLALDSVARFPGYLDMAAKVREGQTADIFLNTNHVDNMPVSIIEACAMGLPVVATNVGGISDLLTDDETGLLVPDDDDEAMAAAILRLLRDPDLAGRLSTNGRQLAQRFSWEQVRPQWEQLFAKLVRVHP